MREHQGQVSQKKYSLFSMEVLITCERNLTEIILTTVSILICYGR